MCQYTGATLDCAWGGPQEISGAETKWCIKSCAQSFNNPVI